MPLAAGLLKAQLDSIPEIKNRLDVSFHDFYIDSSADSIAGSICAETPDIIGFSTYLWNRDLTEEICRIIKNRFPEIILFAGGAEASALPGKLFECAPFDFVIKGEGEFALTETVKRILENKPVQGVRGVYAKNSINDAEPDQWPVENLDALTSPFLTGVIDLKKYSGVLWELSRGCPFKCSFCFESRGVAGVRQYSLDRLQKELELFESQKVNQVFVLDPTFNHDAKRAKKILRMIQKTAPQIHFTFEVRTEFLDSEMAGLFSNVNCSLQIGLQSAVPEVLTNVNRKIDPVQYAAKISLLNSSGVIFGLDLIYGLPGDTIAGFKSSLDFALGLQPNHIDIFPLAVLPGTALYDNAEYFKLNFLEYAPYTLLSSPGFSETDMDRAESLKNAFEILYNKGGAAGWLFMAYETLDIKPSELIENFAEYIRSIQLVERFSGDELIEPQISFVKMLFKKHNKSELFPVMKDIININGAMNSSLYAGPYTGVTRISFDDNTRFALSDGTKFLNIVYSYDDLMQLGDFTIVEFLANFRPEKTSVIIYNCAGVVKPLIVSEELSGLLQLFTGNISLKEILSLSPSINPDEVYEFLEYAISETILYII